MLYCWGNGAFGQLGLGESGVSEPVPFRREPRASLGREVVLVACGERHTVLLRADGSVASCGDNSRGQLGRRLPEGGQRSYVPELIQALETQIIVLVSCGKEHSLAVCKKGNIYSWGAGDFGQLGTGEFRDRLIPKKIEKLSTYKIIQIACGDYHSVALTRDGRVFSWGQNTHGQLGLGKEISSQAQPNQVSALDGIPLAQVAAGGAHSFALSISGVVYGWGRNNARQLGLSQKEPKVIQYASSTEQIFKPYSVAALRNLNVTYVSCGAEHTAVLTQNGSVFTFGDDSAGQLGHNFSSPKTGPQKVDWIGGPVSSLACGSYHTLVSMSASGQLISFGRGPPQHNGGSTSHGKQDETRSFDISALVSSNELLGVQVKQVFAGTYVNFATSCQKQAVVYRNETTSVEHLDEISQLDGAQIEKWMSATAESEMRQKARREIETIFSSPACLTASFLKPRSSLEDASCILVDLEKVREVLVELSKRDWIAGRISFCLRNYLIPALPMNSPHQEAVSAFLLLPECSAALAAQKQEALTLPFAKAVLGLSRRSSDLLEKYWSLLPTPFLDQIVQMLKKGVLAQASYYNLPQWLDVFPLLEVLKKVYKLNKMMKYKLQLCNFYIDELPEKLNLLEELLRWHEGRHEPDVNISVCCFPFILNLLSKMRIFYFISFVEQEHHKADAQRMLTLNRLLKNDEFPKIPIFILRVQRQHLLEDTFQKLGQVEDTDLKKQLFIEFKGEMSKPESQGILIEFFSYVFEEIVQPDYGMFTYCERNSPMWFPSRPSVEKNRYFLFGILCGLAMFNRVITYVPFPLAAFKKLLGKKPSVDDLKELSPVLGRSLQALLDYEHNDVEENFQLCYSIFWDNMNVDLIPDGSLIPVNNKNRRDFVNKYVDYIFNKSVEDIFKEFRRGLYKVLDEQVVGFFEPEELMDVAIGNANYDWELYEKNAVYWGPFSPDHSTIKMFWKVFHELPLADKKGFLLFVSGTDRIPLMGMESVKLIIHSHASLSEDHIPEAQICFHILLLPPYSTTEKLKEKLLLAIENNRGFGKQQN